MFQRATGKPIEKELAYAVLSGNAETVTLCLPHTMMISVVRIQVPLRSLQQIGHSTIAIGLAVIAGLIGSYVARKRQISLHE